MKTSTWIGLLLAVPALTGCFTQSYLLSPSHNTSNFYHAIPLRADSIRSATYISGTLAAGGANQNLRNQIFNFNGYVHRSHTFKKFEAYYGANISLGTYDISENTFIGYYGYNTPNFNSYGRKFYGSAGASGGFNFVVPMGTRHEWRVIGLESTLQNEFGQYYDLRKNLSDSLSNAITRGNLFVSVGVTTEFAFNLRRGGSICYKLGVGGSMEKTKRYYRSYYNGNSDYYGQISPAYFSNTLQITRDKITGFGQINFGDYAANFQMGVSYRLAAKKKITR